MGGMSDKAETIVETMLLLAVFAAILYLGPGAASGHVIRHDFPMGYGASDAFQHEARAESIREMGQYRNEASYLVVGLTGLPGFYPPLLYHVPVLLSDLSGLPSYDALFLVMGLVLALGAMMAYYLARHIGKPAAILALPLTLFIAMGKPFLGIMTFGQMALGMSSLFLVATAWAMAKTGFRKSYLLIALFFAATINTHTSETIFLGILLAALAAIIVASRLASGKGIMQKLSGVFAALRENKAVAIGIALGTIASFYFLDIFIGAWMKAQARLTRPEAISPSFPAATVFVEKDFGFMGIALLLGVIFLAILLVQKRRELPKVFQTPSMFAIIFSFYMLLAGLSTYVGFGLRAFQTRMFWPITLAPLAGFGTYQLVKLLAGLVVRGSEKIFYISLILAVALSVAAVGAYYTEPSPGSLDKDHFEPMKWISENTPREARVYALYSYVYAQTSSLYNTKRVSYFLELENLAKLMGSVSENGSMDTITQVTIASDSGIGFPYRKGLITFGQRIHDTPTSGLIDICSADYYMVEKAFPANAQPIAQANLYLLQRFISGNMTVVYDNPAVTVLKNNDISGDCIGE